MPRQARMRDDPEMTSWKSEVVCSSQLRAAVREFLAQPSRHSLESARAAWISCRDAYGRTEALRFSGVPIDDLHPVTGVQGPEGRINSWPIDEAYLDYVAGAPKGGLISENAKAIQSMLARFPSKLRDRTK